MHVRPRHAQVTSETFQKGDEKVNFKLISALAAGLLSAAPAFSAPVTLDFEGASSFGSIDGYYNGGTDQYGASGPNLGVSFGLDALALSNDGVSGPGSNGEFYSNAPSPGTVMAVAGPSAALNVASGFVGEVSFYYSSSAASSVSLFSGLDGTGSLLGTISLDANGCADGSPYCFWKLATLDFSGVAQSIQFGGASLAAFDNVTVAPVPLPAAAWLLVSALE